MREVKGEGGENEKRMRQEMEGQRAVEEVLVLEESQGVQLERIRHVNNKITIHNNKLTNIIFNKYIIDIHWTKNMSIYLFLFYLFLSKFHKKTIEQKTGLPLTIKLRGNQGFQMWFSLLCHITLFITSCASFFFVLLLLVVIHVSIFWL